MNRSADPGGIVHDHRWHTFATLLSSQDNSSRTVHDHMDRMDRPFSKTV
jgi:hypothetical protein